MAKIDTAVLVELIGCGERRHPAGTALPARGVVDRGEGNQLAIDALAGIGAIRPALAAAAELDVAEVDGAVDAGIVSAVVTALAIVLPQHLVEL